MVSLEKRLLEKLAELEHKQWSHWIKYQKAQKELAWLDFFRKTEKPQFNSNTMERWIVQSLTPYSKLTEKEKESDREWARKVLAIFQDYVAVIAQQIREIFEECWLDGYGENSEIYESDLKERVLGLLVEQEEKNSVPLRDTLVEGASDFEHQDEGLGIPSSQRAKDGRAKSPLLRPETVDEEEK